MTYSIIITITIIMYYSVYKVDYRERTAAHCKTVRWQRRGGGFLA